MNSHISLGSDAFGRHLEDKLRRARDWALDQFTKDDANLDDLAIEAKKTFGVSVPKIIFEALWVEYKTVGNGRNVAHSESDSVVIHVPLSGTADLMGHVEYEHNHDAPKIRGDELVIVQNSQLSYFPERKLDTSGARAAGEAILKRALQIAENGIQKVEQRRGDIDRYGDALEAALSEQREKVENARLYRTQLEAGIDLPTARPSVEIASTDPDATCP